jgi:hypothetical protein
MISSVVISFSYTEKYVTYFMVQDASWSVDSCQAGEGKNQNIRSVCTIAFPCSLFVSNYSQSTTFLILFVHMNSTHKPFSQAQWFAVGLDVP